MLDGVAADATAASNNRMLQVLQIGMEWFTPGAPGGLARYYNDLFKSLPLSGVAPVGLVCSPDNVAALSDGRVQSFAPEGASTFTRAKGVRQAVGRVLHAQPVDVVACHFALYGLPVLDRIRRLPLVYHFHGPWAEESGREGERSATVLAKRALERLVYRRAERVITLSEAFADLAERQYGVRRERLRVIPGSVDVARFAVPQSRAEARATLCWPNDRPILLTVRRLMGRMGLDRLIAAMASVVRAQPDVLLYIAGKGPQAAALQAQAEALQLDRNIRFLGFVPDAELPLAYRAADINLLPSDVLEGFGLSAAEALAAGTPTMVTPVGGLPDVVRDLSAGLIFQSGRSEHLAEGLSAALNGSVRLPDSAACRAYASDRFSLSLCGRRVAAVYREVA